MLAFEMCGPSLETTVTLPSLVIARDCLETISRGLEGPCEGSFRWAVPSTGPVCVLFPVDIFMLAYFLPDLIVVA